MTFEDVRPAKEGGFGRWLYFIRRHLTRNGILAAGGCWLVGAGFLALIVVLLARREWTPEQAEWTSVWPLYEAVSIGLGIAVMSFYQRDHVPAAFKAVTYALVGAPFIAAVAFLEGGMLWLGTLLGSKILSVTLHRPSEKEQIGRAAQFFVALITLGVSFVLMLDVSGNHLPKFHGGALGSPLKGKLIVLAAAGAVHFFLMGAIEILLDPFWVLPDLADRRLDRDWWRR